MAGIAGEVLAALARPDFPWLLGFALLAALVRGFTGFGAGLVFIPLAATVVPPVAAVVLLLVVDLAGALPLLPRSRGAGAGGEVARLTLGALAGLPAGVALLAVADPAAFRWAVALVCLAAVLLLALGWRWRGRPALPATLATGAVSGFLGGFAGVSGPPVILYYLGSARAAAEIRAGLILYFFATTLVALGLLAFRGLVGRELVVLALLLVVPYMLAGLAGARLFRLAGERDFRYVSYATIAAAALAALPLGR